MIRSVKYNSRDRDEGEIFNPNEFINTHEYYSGTRSEYFHCDSAVKHTWTDSGRIRQSARFGVAKRVYWISGKSCFINPHYIGRG